MDVAKLLGVIIGAVLLAFGLAKAIPILSLVGFVILAGSMVWVATTAYSGTRRTDPHVHS